MQNNAQVTTLNTAIDNKNIISDFIVDQNIGQNVATANDENIENELSVFGDDVEANASSKLDQMANDRNDWENGSYKKSNTDLYNILANCLEFCTDLDGKKNKARNKALKDFYTLNNYSYNENHPLANRVVRAVFGNIHRSRICTYALVVNEAKRANVNPTELASWIENQGGVQEIKVSNSPNYVESSVKISKAKNYVETSNTLGMVNSEALSKYIKNETVGKDCILLATQNDNGGFDIKAVTRQEGALSSVYKAIYSDKVKDLV
jgi:hypothetical protein